MGKAGSLRTVQRDEEPNEDPPRLWRERHLSEEELFEATDEVGRTGWFIRLDITGLFSRRLGPFDSKDAALKCFEECVARMMFDPLCELQAELTEGQYVIEGIPRLTGKAGAP